MKTVTKTALANLKLNRGRNLISGAAILLTTLLIFFTITIGLAAGSVELAAVNVYYPTYHAMFRGVTEENVQRLESQNEIETMGLREDFAYGVDDDADIGFYAMDEEGIRLSKIELEEGHFPREGKEIALSRGLLAEYGLEAGIGDQVTLPFQLVEDGGLGWQQEDTFRITGFLETDTDPENKAYGVICSLDYMRASVPAEDRAYRVLLRLKDTQEKGDGIETVDALEEKACEMGEDFGVDRDNVVVNTTYLLANYTDPGLYTGIGAIILVVVAAGVLCIYSIYYVSMVPKIQEYGRLRAMGATRRQIRQIVFREGLAVAFAALPAGLLLGSILARPVLLAIYKMAYDVETAYTEPGMHQLCVELIEKGQVPILRWWIYLLTVLAVLATVWLSLVKPMRLAARISPVEAMRYQGGSSRKKDRRGYESLNISRLTRTNLGRNKRRTVLTVLTLGSIGILFMAVATVLSCASPKEIARQEFEGDYQIYVDSWEGDKMNPDRAWASLMKDNPLSSAFAEEVRSVPGVEEVKVRSWLTGSLPELDPEEQVTTAKVEGYEDSYKEAVLSGITEGTADWEELKRGEKIIMNQRLQHWFPELTAGSQVKLLLETEQGPVERTFEIAAVGAYPSGICTGNFLLPAEALGLFTQADLSQTLVITVDKEQKEEAFQVLDAMAQISPYLATDTYDTHLQTWESGMGIIALLGYAFLIVLGAIGIMNLVNTMINSIYTRKKELGMMQAIGLSERQLLGMMQMEGLFYTAGTLAVALGIGSLAGYGVFRYMKAENIMNVTSYHYPALPAVLLALVVALTQVLLTCAVSRSFRKMSLIDRIRYSE